jgi:(p)ppGpp synthase/HD superfamily hydrolase
MISELPLKGMDALLLQRAIILKVTEIRKSEVYVDYVKVSKAIDLAAYCHRDQRRRNRGNMPSTHYIEHPLRNALRIMRYGCTDQDIIVAAILHDTVEDSLSDLLLLSTNATPPDWGGREHVYDWFESEFGFEVARLVHSVTNPLPGKARRTKDQKRADYVELVTKKISDPKTALVKLSDFIDNAAGLYHQNVFGNEEMISHLAKKYSPLVPVFLERVQQDDFRALVSDEGYALIVEQLNDAGLRLALLMNLSKGI